MARFVKKKGRHSRLTVPSYHSKCILRHDSLRKKERNQFRLRQALILISNVSLKENKPEGVDPNSNDLDYCIRKNEEKILWFLAYCDISKLGLTFTLNDCKPPVSVRFIHLQLYHFLQIIDIPVKHSRYEVITQVMINYWTYLIIQISYWLS